MANNSLLIFDLDDTIFETKSISHHHVSSILESFRTKIEPIFPTDQVASIMADLWKYPYDYVASKYQLEDSTNHLFTQAINNKEYDLEIKPFDDYHLVKNLNISKVLVTTGFKKLQLAKIKALKIENDFNEIHVDAIDAKHRIHKSGIFKNLLQSTKRSPSDYFVIGDNPKSELKAGKELGFTTIQVAKFNQPKSSMADFYIAHFQELLEILV